MFQYLIVQLDDCSTSFCHYESDEHQRNLMPLEILHDVIFFAMKENLMIQYVLPDYQLPDEYKRLMDTIDNGIIVSSLCEDDEMKVLAKVVVLHDWAEIEQIEYSIDKAYLLRTTKEDLFKRYNLLRTPFARASRFNIVITDIEKFNQCDFQQYRQVLSCIGQMVEREYCKSHFVECNILTDRLTIDRMNNCGAGDTTITVAPNGGFYICPAFYMEGAENSVGDIWTGIKIPNAQLYKIKNAPICRHCDAFHCKRCVWLNKNLTLEVNTPSKQQCVTSHLERNTSLDILIHLRKSMAFLEKKDDLKPIGYLDPLDVKKDWDKDIIKEELERYHQENY